MYTHVCNKHMREMDRQTLLNDDITHVCKYYVEKPDVQVMIWTAVIATYAQRIHVQGHVS